MNTLKNRFVNPKSAALFLFVAGLIIAGLKLYRTFLIFRGYNDPPSINPFPTLFEYTAYGLVPLIFAHSWKQEPGKRRLLLTILTAIAFVIGYLFILNYLDWQFGSNSNHLWKSFLFTIKYSFPVAFAIFAIIGFLMVILGAAENQTKGPIKKLSYRFKNETHFVDVDQIYFFESSDNYIGIHFPEKQFHLVRKTLSALEKQLDPDRFVRIHRKYIVNQECITSLSTTDTGGTEVELSNGSKLPVSKSFKLELKSRINSPH